MDKSVSSDYPLLYCSRFRREHRTYLIQFTAVRLIFTGIPLFLYLTQSLICCTVKLELKDIHIIRSLHDAIYPTVALDFLSIDSVNTYQTHNQIEGIVKIPFLLTLVLLTAHSIGDAGKEGSHTGAEIIKFPFFQL